MSEHVVSLRLSDQQDADLKATALRFGVSVSHVLRLGIEVVATYTPHQFGLLDACPTCKGTGRRDE